MPLLSAVAERILATVTGFSMNVGSKQSLYTAPPGKTAIITKVVTRNASATIATADGDFGWDASCTDWRQNVNFTDITGAGRAMVIAPWDGGQTTPSPEGFDEGAAGEVFGYFGGTLVAATVDMDIFGYLT